MAELKKCPFCGGEAIIDREDIFCDNCHLSMRIDDRKYNGEAETYEEAREQAIEAWNNRATEAEIRAMAYDGFMKEIEAEYDNDACPNVTDYLDYKISLRDLFRIADELKGGAD